MLRYKGYEIVLEQGESGWIIASVPALPGCHTQGRTRTEAVRNARGAIRGYLAVIPEE